MDRPILTFRPAAAAASANGTHLVFAGGGTGGHLFPGLAVAEKLLAACPALRISFVGSARPLERKLVSSHGLCHMALPCCPAPRTAAEVVPFLAGNVAGFLSARKLIQREQVGLVVGLGGYTSAPMARAALAQKIPLLLLEQNAQPGRVTRWLAPRATLVCAAFDTLEHLLPGGCRVLVTGNPVRDGFAACRAARSSGIELPAAEASVAASPPFKVHQEELPATADSAASPSSALSAEVESQTAGPRLLVLGGSQGYGLLNEAVPYALSQLRPFLQGWSIVHQTGEADLHRTRSLYRDLLVPASVVPFVNHMPEMMRSAALAISCCGGTTLAELAAAQLPAVLVPWPGAKDDHQRANAQLFVAGGAARLVDPQCRQTVPVDKLRSALKELLSQAELRQQMAQRMAQLARPQAAVQVAQLALSILGIDTALAGACQQDQADGAWQRAA